MSKRATNGRPYKRIINVLVGARQENVPNLLYIPILTYFLFIIYPLFSII